MKRYVVHVFLILMLAVGSSLQAVTYCLDGGGSKTLLNVVDDGGNVLAITFDGLRDRIASGSNINVVGRDGFKAVLQELFLGLDIKPDDYIILGAAGLGLPANKEIAIMVLEELGFASDHMTIFSDAAIALELIDGDGAILISGTGSSSFVKKSGVAKIIGGRGTVLGDEGSAYRIGLNAIAKAIDEDENGGRAVKDGFGTPTSLTKVVRDFFKIASDFSLRTLNGPIMHRTISAAEIAKLAPMVFKEAYEGNDAIAMKIIDDAAKELGRMLMLGIHRVDLVGPCPLHFWGGTFKNKHADDFIQKIMMSHEGLTETYVVTNRAYENSAVALAQKRLGLADVSLIS